jgi:putative tricarboxylic transport membrane protein
MKIHTNLVIGILGILLAIFVWIISAEFPIFQLKGAGPDFYPRSIALFILGLSILLINEGYRVETKNNQVITKRKLRKLFITLIILVIYYLLLELLGYFVTTFAMCLSVSLLLFSKLNKKTIIMSLFSSTVICFAIYIIFRVLLKAPLPNGLLF